MTAEVPKTSTGKIQKFKLRELAIKVCGSIGSRRFGPR